MRIVFFGTPELAVPSLEALIPLHDVCGVVCQPDKPMGRSKKLQPPPVKVCAESHGIAVEQPVKLNDGTFEAWLKERNPDLCALVAYGRILKQPILDVPKFGFLNVHPSLLPKYRGPSPIQSAILNGETETGVTIMRIDAGMDSGDMLLQESTAIPDDESAESLTPGLADMGARMLVTAIKLAENGNAEFTPQNDDEATFCQMLTKADGRISWQNSARHIHNQVRGCRPWPVAQTKFGDAVLKIHRTQVVEQQSDTPPGTLIATEDVKILVSTNQDSLAILELQAPGKRAMSAADFLRGNPVHPGDRFEDF